MQLGNSLDQFVAISCKMYFHLSLIHDSALPVNESQFLAPGSQRNNAVMLCLKAFCKFANSCPFPVFVSFDMEEQQILKICNAKFAGNIFTKADKATQLVSKIGKRFKFFFGKYFVNFILRQYLFRIKTKFQDNASCSEYYLSAKPQQAKL